MKQMFSLRMFKKKLLQKLLSKEAPNFHKSNENITPSKVFPLYRFPALASWAVVELFGKFCFNLA